MARRRAGAGAFASSRAGASGLVEGQYPHAHVNSDGDSTPDDVVRWYREHGYQFLVLTDHNFLTSVDGLNALHGADEQFLVIKGEEVTDQFGDKSLHINGLDVSARSSRRAAHRSSTCCSATSMRFGGGAAFRTSTIRTSAGRSRATSCSRCANNRLFEIYNGHPQVNNLGGGGVPGLEEVWDAILSSGTLLYGIAVDDAHTFKEPGNPARRGTRPRLGDGARRRGSRRARMLEALERGDFYASTGVELTDYRGDAGEHDRHREDRRRSRSTGFSSSARAATCCRNRSTARPTYAFRGDEGYVRARVIESNGRVAWAQPVMVK